MRLLPVPASDNFPTLSTGGAPQTNVPEAGSNIRGMRCSSRRGRTPRCLGAVAVAVGGNAGGDTAPASIVSAVSFDASAAPRPSAVPSSDLCRPDPAMSARASSSTSSNLSCFTAPMEYAHTPTAKPASTTPVMALCSLNG